MVPRRLIPLVAVLALAAPAVSGCGADDVDVADAAAATAKKGTASYTFRLGMTGFGLPSRVDLRANGVTSLSEPRMTLDADLAPVLASVGLPAGSAPIKVRIDGGTVYVKPPELPGITVPGGKDWISIDLAKAAEAFGIDAAGLGALMAVDPAATLRFVTTAKGLREVGEETINGTKTRHFRGAYRMSDVIGALPAAKRGAAREALDQLNEKLGDDGLTKPTPVDAWIDRDGVLRRMTVAQALPGGRGSPGGRFTFAYDLTKFGTELDVGRPASVYDATRSVVDVIKALGSLSAPGTLG